jgi:UDP-glucuronate decarboxylase
MTNIARTSSLSRDSMTGARVVDGDVQYVLAACRDELRQMAGRKLLFTGGGGFLGYLFCHVFVAWNESSQPIDVTVTDNFLRGVPPWLEPLRKRGGSFRFIEHDVTTSMDRFDFDYVIHGASIASPTFYRLHPIETIDANVWGLRKLLDQFRQRRESGGAAAFLFFSSSEIYGDPDPGNIPTSENYRGHVSCTGPRACYDESKRFGETLCANFARVHDLPITSVRPFNNYGPGLRLSDRRVIPDFASKVLASEDIELLSDGSPTRTFAYVADAVTGYIKALLHGKRGDAYNIGVETPEISMRDLAEMIVRIARVNLGYQGKVIHRASNDAEYLTDNPNRRCPDISKARAEIGYHPTIDLEEGLRRTLAWYADNRS